MFIILLNCINSFFLKEYNPYGYIIVILISMYRDKEREREREKWYKREIERE